MAGVVLDEVHCLWPSCCHKCCWESEQRIREGRPKILRDPDTPFTRPCRESRFPVITSVDAGNWIEDDFISLMALSRDAASQKSHHGTPRMSAKMETSQDNKMLKLGFRLSGPRLVYGGATIVSSINGKHSLNMDKFTKLWDKSRHTTEEAHLHWKSLSIQVFPPAVSSCEDASREDTRDFPKARTMNRRFKHGAFKNTDTQLSRRSSGRPELNIQSDSDLVIRGITAPFNSKQSPLASSTVELNQ